MSRELSTSVQICEPLHRFTSEDADGDKLVVRFYSWLPDHFSFSTQDAGGHTIITHLTHSQVSDLISFLNERLLA